MTEKKLNNCMILHIHKELTDQMDLLKIAKKFVACNFIVKHLNDYSSI